jgi:hypothetical protein
MKNLNALRDEVSAINKANGWHEEKRSFGELIALVHSEASEALEDYRNGKAVNEVWYEYKNLGRIFVSDKKEMEDGSITDYEGLTEPYSTALGKPCGIPSELADIVIRILDICGLYEWDVEKTHEHSIGERGLKGKTFLELLSEIHLELSQAYIYRDAAGSALDSLDSTIQIIEFISRQYDINLKTIIRQKLEYNKTRGYKHGGKVI